MCACVVPDQKRAQCDGGALKKKARKIPLATTGEINFHRRVWEQLDSLVRKISGTAVYVLMDANAQTGERMERMGGSWAHMGVVS